MKFSHEIKFQMNRQYEMHTASIEVDDTEFPELADLPFIQKARFLQGTLLQQGLLFQAASGYLLPNSEAFRESWRLATELKGVIKVNPPKLKSVGS